MYQEALKSVANLNFRDLKNYAGIYDCQSTDFIKLHYHFNALEDLIPSPLVNL